MGPAAPGTGQTKALFETADAENGTDVKPLSVAGMEKGESDGNGHGDKGGGKPASGRDAVGRFFRAYRLAIVHLSW